MPTSHGHPIPVPEGAGVAADPHPDWQALADIQAWANAAPGSRLDLTDLGARPDSFPCLAALAALRHGETQLLGAPALRHKESDRIKAMAELLKSLGGRCEERPDGLIVHGPLPQQGATLVVPTPDDHRIVMAAALLGTRLKQGVFIENPEAANKSWPGFFHWLTAWGACSDSPRG